MKAIAAECNQQRVAASEWQANVPYQQGRRSGVPYTGHYNIPGQVTACRGVQFCKRCLWQSSSSNRTFMRNPSSRLEARSAVILLGTVSVPYCSCACWHTALT